MKTIIILKGLSKLDKINWVKGEGLENFLIDREIFVKLLSFPELTKGNKEVLWKSYSPQVENLFIETLCTRLSKGCLVVVDNNNFNCSTIEKLSMVYGYSVFYKVFSIPQNYFHVHELPYKIKEDKIILENNVKSFLNFQLNNKNSINTYSDLVSYWENYGRISNYSKILHISDLHSNYSLFKEKFDPENYEAVVFHGDYIDGPEEGGSRKIIDYILSHINLCPSFFLEGNHEMRLRKYLGYLIFKESRPKIANLLYSELPLDFINTTMKEFEDLNSNSAENMLRAINNKLLNFITINRGEDTHICTHAGFRDIGQLTPKYIGNVIYGNRDIDVQDREVSNKYTDIYSIHAHHKYPSKWQTMKYERVLNIDPPNSKSIVFMENIVSEKFKTTLIE